MRLPFTFRWPFVRRERRLEDYGPLTADDIGEQVVFTAMQQAQTAMMDEEGRMRPFDEAVARFKTLKDHS
ncbi:MAG: hypothetical protein IIC89_08980 [Chloroflexi bacterium]|nr:hypothetical protein [Chloroflexota bacterium]